MTLSPWIIYLWGIADSINNAAHFFSVGSGIATLVCTVCYLACKYDNDERGVEVLPIKTVWVIFLAAFSINVAFPSSKTIAVMVVAPAIVNSAPIQKDLPELYKVAKDALMSTLTK